MELSDAPEELHKHEGEQPETDLQKKVRAALEAHARDPQGISTKSIKRADDTRPYADLGKGKGPEDGVASILTATHAAASPLNECGDAGAPAEDRTPTNIRKHNGGPFNF